MRWLIQPMDRLILKDGPVLLGSIRLMTTSQVDKIHQTRLSATVALQGTLDRPQLIRIICAQSTDTAWSTLQTWARTTSWDSMVRASMVPQTRRWRAATPSARLCPQQLSPIHSTTPLWCLKSSRTRSGLTGRPHARSKPSKTLATHRHRPCSMQTT